MAYEVFVKGRSFFTEDGFEYEKCRDDIYLNQVKKKILKNKFNEKKIQIIGTRDENISSAEYFGFNALTYNIKSNFLTDIDFLNYRLNSNNIYPSIDALVYNYKTDEIIPISFGNKKIFFIVSSDYSPIICFLSMTFENFEKNIEKILSMINRVYFGNDVHFQIECAENEREKSILKLIIKDMSKTFNGNISFLDSKIERDFELYEKDENKFHIFMIN